MFINMLPLWHTDLEVHVCTKVYRRQDSGITRWTCLAISFCEVLLESLQLITYLLDNFADMFNHSHSFSTFQLDFFIYC